jgi:soluble lytic murein transglycosylase
MFKFIFILFVLIQNLSSEETKISREWLQEKPKSHIKDFYLWRYMDQNQNDDDIIWALSEANNANHKIFIKYNKKSKDEASNFVVNCSKLPTNELLKTDADCINIGLSILEATNIKGEQLSKVIEKIKKSYLQKNEKLSIINAKEPFEALLESSSNEVFFGTFNEVGESFRIQYFNAFIPQKMISKLQEDTQKFQKMIKTIVTTPQITTIQQSLFDVDTKKIDFTHTFFLAMNAIKHERKEIALKYLSTAEKKATKKSDQDNVTFWQYKLTNEKNILNN